MVRFFFRTLLFHYKCKMFIFSNSHYLLMFLRHNYDFRGSNSQYISKRKHNTSKDSKDIKLSSHTLF